MQSLKYIVTAHIIETNVIFTFCRFIHTFKLELKVSDINSLRSELKDAAISLAELSERVSLTIAH